jgi:hypothetical protein
MGIHKKSSAGELCDRISNYLGSGEIPNPGMAIQDDVRGLLADCREHITLEDFRNLELKIKQFAENQEKTTHCWAMLKVGRERGDDYHIIMRNLLVDILMTFHNIPLNKEKN